MVMTGAWFIKTIPIMNDMFSYLFPSHLGDSCWISWMLSLNIFNFVNCRWPLALKAMNSSRGLERRRKDFLEKPNGRGPNPYRNAVCITVWWFQPLWKIFVKWDDYSQHMAKTCSKPPSRAWHGTFHTSLGQNPTLFNEKLKTSS